MVAVNAGKRRLVATLPKFCTNCKHFLPDATATKTLGHCAKFPVFTDFDTHMNYLITGAFPDTPYEFVSCITARRDPKLCGNEGRYYKCVRK